MRFKLQSVKYPSHRWAMQSNEVFETLGVAGTHWPDAGLPARVVQGIKVWVAPKVVRPGRKSSKHRVMCACPGCGRVFSVGRLAQHVCKEAM